MRERWEADPAACDHGYVSPLVGVDGMRTYWESAATTHGPIGRPASTTLGEEH